MIAKMIQVGNNYMVLLTVVATTSPFYFATMEEYYTGGLFLGPGNGITDGSVVLIALFIYCGAFGTSVFTKVVEFNFGGAIYSYKISQFFIIGVLTQQTIACIYK